MLHFPHLTVLSSEASRSRLDKVQNAALRSIIGAAKSTPIPALELQAGIEPLQVRREKALLKFWERNWRINSTYWSTFQSATGRLKTQLTPIAKGIELMRKYGIVQRQAAPLHTFHTTYRLPEARLNIPGVHKNVAYINEDLRQSALELIEKDYPEEEWTRVYTDGSHIPETGATGAGYYCRSFEGCVAVGTPGTSFDGEVVAISEACSKIPADVNKVVFLVDSQAAITSVCSNRTTDNELVTGCRGKLATLLMAGTAARVQWIPSHVGIYGNERADQLAKAGAELPQPESQVPLSTAKAMVNLASQAWLQRHYSEVSSGKVWARLLERPLPRDVPRAQSVAAFRLLTGHDYLQAHLFKIGVVTTDQCPLCDGGRQDAHHLQTCSALTPHNVTDPIGAYWEARRLMAEMPRAGIG